MTDATTLSVFDRVADAVALRFRAQRARLTPETDLFGDLEGDSLDRVELAMDLEDAFDVEIPDELVETCRTVGDFARGLERRLWVRDLSR